MAVAWGRNPKHTPLSCKVMNTRIGLCILLGLSLLGSAGGNTSAEALQPLVETQDASNVIVPNVTGIPSDVALQILQIAGLNGKIQRGSGRSLTVDSQAPKAGSLVAPGSEIVLALGKAVIQSKTLTTFTSKDTQHVTVMTTTPGTNTQEQQNMYYTSSVQLDVANVPAWYPKRFLEASQTNRSVPSILGTQRSGGPNNILGGKPLNTVSGDQVPIIMLRTEGWQNGWIPNGSYASSQSVNVSPSSSLSSSGLNIQRAGDTFASVSVPAVRRLSFSDAEIAFKKAGLEIGSVTKIEDYHLRSGIVLEQFPAAKTLVQKGTKIDLRVVK